MTVLSPALTAETPEERIDAVIAAAVRLLSNDALLFPEAIQSAIIAEWGLNERTLFIAAARGDLSAQGLPAHMVAPLSKLSQSPGPNGLLVPPAEKTPVTDTPPATGPHPGPEAPNGHDTTTLRGDEGREQPKPDREAPEVKQAVRDGPAPSPDLGQSMTVAEACEALGNNLDLVGPRFRAWRAMDRPRRVSLAGGLGYWPSKTDYVKPDGSPEWSSLYVARKDIIVRMSPSERYWLVTGVK